jgi:hypothetical protein
VSLSILVHHTRQALNRDDSLHSHGVGVVIRSECKDVQIGDHVYGYLSTLDPGRMIYNYLYLPFIAVTCTAVVRV